MASLADLKLVYLIYGPEDLLLDRAVTRLRDRFAEEGDTDFNAMTFDGDAADADEIVAAANTLPFMAERRLVVVRGVDKMSASAQERLARYAEDPADFTTLVLVAEKVNKSTKLYRAVEKSGQVAQYKADKSEYPAQVREMFASRGRQADRDAVELLVQAVGLDLKHLEIEVDKAVAFGGKKERLSRADIEAVLATEADTTMWDFLDALSARDAALSIRLCSQLLGQNESIFALHRMAVGRMRELVAAQALIERGEGSATALAAALGKQEWQVRRIPKYARQFRKGEPAELLGKAAATEAEMKTSRDDRLAFERWILEVCGT